MNNLPFHISLNKPLSVAYIDNFYNPEEFSDIMRELVFLSKNFKEPKDTGTAYDNNKNIIKKNKGIFLDNVYNDRSMSDILNINRKIFQQGEKLGKPYDAILANCDFDSTLISYYENSDFYKAHTDTAILTVLTYFYAEPKFFTGGDLFLPYFNTTLNCVNNRVYFMYSFIDHEVTPVKMDSVYLNKNLGRFCMTQFLRYSR